MSHYMELIGPLVEEASSQLSLQSLAALRNLRRILDTPAPNNGCTMPGAVGEVIYDLALNWNMPVKSSQGNILITLGKQSNSRCDLLICSHMDRPSFRVKDLNSSRLYPLCAVRIPGTTYRCPAIAVRATNGKLRTSSEGTICFLGTESDRSIHYIASSGRLAWGDTILMHSPLTINDNRLTAPGLDNASGVLINLMFAHLLHKQSAELEKHDIQIICAFTDQEEGPPTGLFGQGAARLSRQIDAPYVGFINIDAHNADANGGGATLGNGISHAFVSGRGRGSIVPLRFQDIAEKLAAEEYITSLAQINYGYVSRSDDMLLSLWARCLALIGAPLENAHTAEETIHLQDLLTAQAWLAAFVPLALAKGLS